MFFVCCQLQSMARAVLVSLCAFTRLVSDFKPPLKRSWRACLFVLAAIYFSGENNNRAPHIQCAPSRERERQKQTEICAEEWLRLFCRCAWDSTQKQVSRSRLNWWRINYFELFSTFAAGRVCGLQRQKRSLVSITVNLSNLRAGIQLLSTRRQCQLIYFNVRKWRRVPQIEH